MGRFADSVRDHVRDALAERRPRLAWETEHRVGRTPVDVVGRGDDRLVAVEIEWRRADPVNNTAKLFYHVSQGALDGYGTITICQVFSAYYDLADGGSSSKREVAEFVGGVVADRFDRVSYHPLRFDLDPPKRGAERPKEWRAVADETAAAIGSLVDDG